MLSSLIQLDQPSPRPALITPDETLSWIEFAQSVDRQRQTLAALSGGRIGIAVSPAVESLSQLVALTDLGCHVFLAAEGTPPDEMRIWGHELGWTHGIAEPQSSPTQYADVVQANDPAAVTILTSGTTGKPKAAEHTWATLVRPVRRDPNANNPRWLLTFRPHLYAGIQVILQCLLNRGCLVMPRTGSTAAEAADLAARSSVEFASATPSYWRWLLTLSDRAILESMPLRQITLGGEAVDQRTLDALRARFPQTRLVHIYATTELGRCFSVTDGRAGFPTSFLEQASSDGVSMRIKDGELIVSSKNSMRRYDGSAELEGNEFPTGDLVTIEGDRVLFVGRKTEMINVGGNKVYPLAVERVIRLVAGVVDTRVYGEASSIVGQLVKCDVVVEDGCDPIKVTNDIRAAALDSLTAYQRPRLIEVVDEIPRTAAGKVQR